MATNPVQFSQLSDFSGTGGQYQQPYPYNNPAYAGDQYPSASLPQAQVQNFIQSPPAPRSGQPANQPRFGERTVARPSVRRRKQQTPRGPIVAKDGTKPVVPLYSYQALKNNTVVQVPIFWTALNIALGYQVQGDQVIRGLPCIKRLRQLFCTNAGSQYPMDRIESFINENKALTRRMFGAYPPPPPDFASEVAPPPEMEPFETVDFTTESFPLDQGFLGESLPALEVTEPPPPPRRPRGGRRGRGGGTGGRNDLRRVGRDGGASGGRNEAVEGGRSGGRSAERNAARDAGRLAGGRGGVGSRGARKSSGSTVETVVETPPVGGSTENPPLGEGATTRGRRKGRQDVVELGEFWETGESGVGDFGLEREETEENFVNVDVKAAAPAAGAAGRSGNSTNSTSSTTSNATDLTGPSSLADNFTNSVQTSTEPPFFDETGPSGEIGMEAAGYMESTISGGRRRADARQSFDRRQDFPEDRRGFAGRRGFPDERRKPRRQGAPREISRRLTDTLADTGPSAWSARSARARPRHLRHSFPAEPRPPANQVPTPADVKPTEPISVASATTAKPAPPTKAGGPYVALKVKGCRVLAPSVNRPEKHKLPVTPVPQATEHPPEKQFPRAKRSVDNATSPVAPPEVHRERRQAVPSPPVIDKGSKHLVDSCESKVEIVTPYWAANSAGEIRAIVNTKHFPQAIHQEICKGTMTSRCTGNCLCEQKYTYHRLLSYDPDNDCKGIFIDWFLFPSCCACRCPP